MSPSRHVVEGFEFAPNPKRPVAIAAHAHVLAPLKRQQF